MIKLSKSSARTNGFRFFSDKTVACKSYDFEECKDKSTCTTTKLCESCYALWKVSSGVKTVVRQGCWKQCDSGKDCVGRISRKANNAYFCCCNGPNCNDVNNQTKGEYTLKNISFFHLFICLFEWFGRIL